jgi:hypothetical protein
MMRSYCKIYCLASKKKILFSNKQKKPASSLGQAADPAEFLGSIYQFDEPLQFQPAGLFEPQVTTSVSQVQIKQPGNTDDDNSGNERW